MQFLFVEPEQVRHPRLEEVPIRRPFAEGLGVQPAVLGGVDAGQRGARGEALRVELELGQTLLHQPLLIGIVIDHKIAAVADPIDPLPQNLHTGGVEGRNPQRVRGGTEQVDEPLFHLTGRLVGEGHGQDIPRRNLEGADQVRDAMHDDARLAGTGAGQDEQRPFRMLDGFLLLGIQAVVHSTVTLFARLRG